MISLSFLRACRRYSPRLATTPSRPLPILFARVRVRQKMRKRVCASVCVGRKEVCVAEKESACKSSMMRSFAIDYIATIILPALLPAPRFLLFAIILTFFHAGFIIRCSPPFTMMPRFCRRLSARRFTFIRVYAHSALYRSSSRVPSLMTLFFAMTPLIRAEPPAPARRRARRAPRWRAARRAPMTDYFDAMLLPPCHEPGRFPHSDVCRTLLFCSCHAMHSPQCTRQGMCRHFMMMPPLCR